MNYYAGPQQRDFVIYALCDGADQVRYVGRASSLVNRLKAHQRTKRWAKRAVALMFVRGLENAHVAEREWIRAFLASGATLENVRLRVSPIEDTSLTPAQAATPDESTCDLTGAHCACRLPTASPVPPDATSCGSCDLPKPTHIRKA